MRIAYQVLPTLISNPAASLFESLETFNKEVEDLQIQ